MQRHGHPNGDTPLVEIDAELADLIPQYLSNRWADLAAARRLLDAGDLAALSHMAHKIRGSAASYGFLRLGEIALGIENAADIGDLGGLASHLEAYDAFLRSVRIEYV